MAVRVVPDAVELQVGVTQTRLKCALAVFFALGELDAVRRGLHAVIADLARITYRVKEAWMHRRLAAGKLHRHLSSRFDPQRVVQDFLNLVPGELVYVTDLVRIHETRIAHHVAAIGEVYREDRPAEIGRAHV